MAEPNQTMERTERATPKRRREARQKGRVAKSVELNTALMLITAVILVLSVHPHVLAGLKRAFSTFLSYASHAGDLDHQLRTVAFVGISDFFKIVAPVLVCTMVIAVFANVMQVGFHVSGDSFQPKLQRVNPLQGFKRIFGKRAIVELSKGILKLVLIGLVAYLSYRSRLDDLVRLAFTPPHVILPQTVSLAAAFLIRVVVALALLAAIDYAYQRWDFEKSIMMTKQELKQELKESEGDPHLRSRIRSQQQKLATQRMMEDIKHADVVITNPTRYAVAIGYNKSEAAPRVLAKGLNLIAEKIRAVADDLGIPILEKPELARLLYSEVEVGRLIPTTFFEAVAEVLAYVYALRNKVRR